MRSRCHGGPSGAGHVAMSGAGLSIIIPARNAARSLGRLLERLGRLERPAGWDVEVIAGYSPSADATLQVLRTHGARVVEAPPTGPSAGRNAAVRASRGALLYFVDADCCPLGDDFLIRLIQAVKARSPLGALGGPLLPDPEQRWNPVAVADHFACWFNWGAHREPGRTTLFAPSVSLAMPRAVFEAAGGFDERLRVLEDWDLQERVKALGLPIYFVRELAVTHTDRARLLESWRHSWYWGATYRETYLRRARSEPWWFLDRPGLFWVNLPRLFQHRLRLVTRQAWAGSPGQTLACYPFLVATVLAWALSVCLARRLPTRPEDASPP